MGPLVALASIGAGLGRVRGEAVGVRGLVGGRHSHGLAYHDALVTSSEKSKENEILLSQMVHTFPSLLGE